MRCKAQHLCKNKALNKEISNVLIQSAINLGSTGASVIAQIKKGFHGIRCMCSLSRGGDMRPA